MIAIKYIITTLSLILFIDNNLVSVCDSHVENKTIHDDDDDIDESHEELLKTLRPDEEMKRLYERVYSVEQRSSIFADVIDIYFAYFHKLEMKIRNEITKKFQYSKSEYLLKNSDLKIFKEELGKEFMEILDKYVDIILKHKVLQKSKKGFFETLNRNEQLQFFRDYMEAYNYTQVYKTDE